MSSLKIEERFSVAAPMENVWRFLLDPEGIAPCLPGAELLEVEDERTFHGQMKVKVGPVTVAYKGTIELTEIDEGEHRFQMVGKGKEKGGAGSAKMTMDGRVEAGEPGVVEISVTADVQLAGRIVRFGRGMIQSVSAQLFKQFASNVRESLEQVEAEAAEAAATAEGEGAEAAAAGEAEAAAAGETEAAAAESGEAVEAAGAGQAAEAEEGEGEAGEGKPATAEEGEGEAGEGKAGEVKAKPAASAPSKPATRAIAPREAEPVRALPLLFRALLDMVRGFFRRLFGRRD
ncbi:SRPBCC family protein [Haliangium sp.]|uniref:SRPBCC family protein n=1 Tax=Haliangium sp. TaxID=2663208 RepID=UPI003D12ECE2